MALRVDGLQTKKRILSACVRLFLENGYNKTKMVQIYREAHVSAGSFQNIFDGKDAVLTELVRFMFNNQFGMARSTAGKNLPPVFVYSVETAIQLAITELNENIRDIYLEAYTQKDTLDMIHKATTREIYGIFGQYQPELSENDFYALEIGSAGLMRGYMARPCDKNFTLKKKLEMFTTESLRIYKVPEAEQRVVVEFILNLNVREIARMVLKELFKELSMHYDFSLEGILTEH